MMPPPAYDTLKHQTPTAFFDSISELLAHKDYASRDFTLVPINMEQNNNKPCAEESSSSDDEDGGDEEGGEDVQEDVQDPRPNSEKPDPRRSILDKVSDILNAEENVNYGPIDPNLSTVEELETSMQFQHNATQSTEADRDHTVELQMGDLLPDR